MSFSQNVSFFSQARVVPVLTPDSVANGVAVSRALYEAGLKLQEITLRNSVALETLVEIRREIPGLLVGAGSVLTPEQGEEAIAAGAHFLVSPGCTDGLSQFGLACSVPFLPGVATVSEILCVQALGCEVAKIFPAQALGGIGFLRSVAGPLPAMKFCPTGGIDASCAPGYLALPNVVAVGGSWMAPSELVSQGQFAAIRRLGEQAAAL